MRFLVPAAVVLLTLLGAEPALACRMDSYSLFETQPLAPTGARAFRGRLITHGPQLDALRASEPAPYAEEYFTVVLLGLLERSDGPPIRVYSSSFHADLVNGRAFGGCDRSNYGTGQDVWIVGRPLSDQDTDRITMMARRGSSTQWIDN